MHIHDRNTSVNKITSNDDFIPGQKSGDPYLTNENILVHMHFNRCVRPFEAAEINEKRFEKGRIGGPRALRTSAKLYNKECETIERSLMTFFTRHVLITLHL